MKTRHVKDLMVPLSEYVTVPWSANLYDAVMALEEAQRRFSGAGYRHRAVIVLDENGKAIGKVSQLNILLALEPKYAKVAEKGSLTRFGFSKQYQKTLMDQFRLWDEPFNHICEKAAKTKVTEFMYSPKEEECVEEDASLSEALHQLVMGRHQSLIVTRKGQIVGILKLTDVFMAVFEIMASCRI